MSFFSFSADLAYQLAAVDNVAELFVGLGKRSRHDDVDEIVGNAGEWDELADELIVPNLRRIQRAHNGAHPEALLANEPFVRDDGAMLEGVSCDLHACPHFTIEMETGTGKTYVYLRTMLELHRRYGFSKFIVVVPSVAIVEGVKKAFDDTRDHFKNLFGTTHFSCRVYDGSKAGIVPAFARDVFPALLIATQQSLYRAKNNLYKANDSVISELKPYQWLQRTRPVVILDEPQNMASERSRAAIRTLRPLCVLRYSATHRAGDQPNPVYRLTPVQAFRLGLVKQVQVTGIAELGVSDNATLRLLQVTRNPLRARLQARCLTEDHETRVKVLTFKQGDAIIKQTKLPEHAGLVVVNIRALGHGEPAAIELEDGRTLTTEDELQGSSAQIWKVQIEETIRAHFERQRALRGRGVKVLSLFFIDRVANFIGDQPQIRNLFDASFDALKREYTEWSELEAEEVREAYFAKARPKKSGASQDVYLDDVSEDSAEAKEAFELIMRRKEVLLSFPNDIDPGSKVAFIFAHSALREGWDNPNVFQICTLNQTVSAMKKRQEIGRGLRLCVDQRGHRISDPAVNILTVVANESYETYVRTLQTEYREAGDSPPPTPARSGSAVPKPAHDLCDHPLLRQLWNKLRQRVAYTIDLDTEVLVTEAIARLNDTSTRFPKPKLTVTRGRFVVEPDHHPFSRPRLDSGSACELTALDLEHPIPDFFSRAAEETLLTRGTLRRIFQGIRSEQRASLRAYPEGWANTFVRVVSEVLKDHVAARLCFRAEDAYDDIGPIEQAWRLDEGDAFGFKFPPRFGIRLPRVIGDYNPEGGVLRQGLSLELGRFIAPGGDKPVPRQHDRRKLALAERYFATLGISMCSVKDPS